MASASATSIFREELEDWIINLRRGDKLTCFGKSKGGVRPRCRNKLSNGAETKLGPIFENIAALLKGSRDGLEKLLKEASLLVMCVRYHQAQSHSKLQEWLGMISDSASDCGPVSVQIILIISV